MNLHAALVALIVPPSNLPLVAVLGLVLRRRIGPWLVWGAVAGLVLLSLPVVAQALLVSLELGLPLAPRPGDPPQAIVILSAEVVHLRGPGHKEQIGPLTLDRMLAGVELYHRTHLPILVTGGRIGGRQVTPIAVQMARVLQTDFGVPVRWVEPRSATTWQNAAFSAAILRRDGIGSVYLVTNAWHEQRAILAFRHFGLVPTAAPVAMDALTDQWLPSTGAWRDSYFAFHEWIGFVDYRLKAWLGRPVPPIAVSNKPA
jgi:uncharacterized SAM-binding protein YcdF (DUF218 family)